MGYPTLVISLVALASVAGAQMRDGRPGPPFGPDMGRPDSARLIGAVAGPPGIVVKNAPFSADLITETTQSFPDGNRIRQSSTARMFRDSDGRVRNEASLANLGALAPQGVPQLVFISDPVAGVNFALNLKDKTVTKTVFTPRVPEDSHMGRGDGRGGDRNAPRGATGAPWRRPENPNVKSEELGRRRMAGVTAFGTRTLQTIPAGQIGNEQPIVIVSERWYSPDLRIVVFARYWDPRMGETITRVANLNRSEPPASLFQAPPDFKLMDMGRGGRPGR